MRPWTVISGASHPTDEPNLCVLEVVSPEGADLVLTSHILTSSVRMMGDELATRTQTVKLMFLYSTVSTLKPAEVRTKTHSAGRQTDGGDGGHDLTQLELVQNCGLSSCVKSDHQNAHLLLAEEALEERLEASHLLEECERQMVLQVRCMYVCCVENARVSNRQRVRYELYTWSSVREWASSFSVQNDTRHQNHTKTTMSEGWQDDTRETR